MKQIDEMNYLSDEGKVFKQKETGLIYGWGISLGLHDSIDNYEEIDCPEEFKDNPDYNNLIKKKDIEKNSKKKN